MTHPQVFGQKFTPICRCSAWKTHPFWPHIPNMTQYGSAPPGATVVLMDCFCKGHLESAWEHEAKDLGISSGTYRVFLPLERVSLILFTLLSRSGSNFEHSNISLKENKWDGVDLNSNGLDYCIWKNEGQILWFSADCLRRHKGKQDVFTFCWTPKKKWLL